MRMEPFVKGEHVLFVFAKVNTQTVVRNNQTYEFWLDLCRKRYYGNSGWVPIFNSIAE